MQMVSRPGGFWIWVADKKALGEKLAKERKENIILCLPLVSDSQVSNGT